MLDTILSKYWIPWCNYSKNFNITNIFKSKLFFGADLMFHKWDTPKHKGAVIKIEQLRKQSTSNDLITPSIS